jgi:flagellar hook protein FlgE
MDPLSIARGGLMAASARFEASAVRTAQMGADSTVDPTQEVVDQISAKHQFSANLGVIRVADEMWRSLLAIQER